MTSSPLFIIVAESMEILLPIRHVGCASAASMLMSSNVERSRLRNGPPDAVRMIRCTSGCVPQRMAWCTALCSESTGRISPPYSLAARVITSPAATSTSLFAMPTRFPLRRAAYTAGMPAAPTIAAITASHESSVATAQAPSIPGITSTPGNRQQGADDHEGRRRPAAVRRLAGRAVSAWCSAKTGAWRSRAFYQFAAISGRAL